MGETMRADVVRRWDLEAVTTTRAAVRDPRAVAEECRRILRDGWEALDAGWDGVAAGAVLDAVDAEGRHAAALADGLAELENVLPPPDLAQFSAEGRGR
ncbi:hypothetical protein [Dietzia sp. 179-F 9C3 NHS]|uniref:hypothetical protein n=1 Tax=Dietzia sp. 179-F 9C3 NHS TaxID=3374295 RepID=UPI00387A6C5B